MRLKMDEWNRMKRTLYLYIRVTYTTPVLPSHLLIFPCCVNLTKLGAAVLPCVLEHIQMTLRSCHFTGPPIPRAAILMRILEHNKLTSTCCALTNPLIPGVSILMQVLEHIKMTIFSCHIPSPPTPRAALAPEPLQYLQVTMLSCTSACTTPFIPRAALAPEPLHDLQMAAFAGIGKAPINMMKVLLGSQPLQGLQLASARCGSRESEN